ncbi:MAG: hypothetical protein A3C35_02910 [Omnitrophica bacterium RIFCSPHIGHO2_02_FULL_46_11]|nr:MAG: hypothetical protein A3C35_02910 [Omnitrophica bacterium RIFCSPHIGHO2_02_FULL_46_11]OGW84871.1 MAG: hypothetical protein A3A81_00940 [Omnitrophica bacterium RIFCSPLOWO2_01_FULL_45_10b]
MSRKRIRVYIPGVFELFHVGHLQALEKAKRLGTHLIVGIQGDQGVRRQKGHDPTVRLNDRKKIVSSIECVDQVITYSSPDQTKVLNFLKPDILAVSEFYGLDDLGQMETLVSADRLGIKVTRIPYLKGISTTLIKRKIRELNRK